MASSRERGGRGGGRGGAEALEGRSALVVGASRGIGLETARALGAAGAQVLMVARGEERLRRAADEAGGVGLAADASDAEAVDALRRRVTEEVGGAPDVLVNAAGAFALAPVAATDVHTFDAMLAGNLRAPFLLIRAFLPGMLERGSGHIVSVGSVAGRQPFPHNGAYSASKFGLRGLHAVLDLELRGSGVRATLIEPSATDTELWDAVEGTTPDLPPREAMLPPSAVADAVLFAVTRPADVDVRLLSVQRA